MDEISQAISNTWNQYVNNPFSSPRNFAPTTFQTYSPIMQQPVQLRTSTRWSPPTNTSPAQVILGAQSFPRFFDATPNCDRLPNSSPNGNISSVASNTLAKPKSSNKSRKRRRNQNVGAQENSRPFSAADCVRALDLEKELKGNGVHLVIKYPDPVIDKDHILSYSTEISNVFFLDPIKPRQCYVQLKAGCEVNEVIEKLNRVPFNNSHLHVELKKKYSERDDRAEDIDPCKLFVGNIPKNIPTAKIKELFPGGRMDISDTKATKDAKVSFKSADEAINALKQNFNKQLESRTLNIRFYRLKGSNSSKLNENAPKKVIEIQQKQSQLPTSEAKSQPSSPERKITKRNVNNLSPQHGNSSSPKPVITTNVISQNPPELKNQPTNVISNTVRNNHSTLDKWSLTNQTNKASNTIKTNPEVFEQRIISRNVKANANVNMGVDVDVRVKHERDVNETFLNLPTYAISTPIKVEANLNA